MENVMNNIMHSAWVISKETGLGISYGLKKSWESFRLQAKMRVEVVKFSYKTVKGGFRVAHGTLSGLFVPGGFSWMFSTSEPRKHNDGVVRYYDMDRRGWRSFKKANLISVS